MRSEDIGKLLSRGQVLLAQQRGSAGAEDQRSVDPPADAERDDQPRLSVDDVKRGGALGVEHLAEGRAADGDEWQVGKRPLLSGSISTTRSPSLSRMAKRK